MKYTECPACGTEIIEAEDCECVVYDADNIPVADIECPVCKGSGKTNNYYCSHCNWSYEE